MKLKMFLKSPESLKLMFVTCLTLMVTLSSSEELSCSVDEKYDVTLKSVHVPAYVIQILDNETLKEDCHLRCCGYRGNDGELCTAVSSYTSGNTMVCVLLHCVPFRNCTWTTMKNYYAAKINHKFGTTTTTIATTTIITTTTPTPAITAQNEMNDSIAENDNWNVVTDATTLQQTTKSTTTSTTIKDIPTSFDQPVDENIPETSDDYSFPVLPPFANDQSDTNYKSVDNGNGGNDDGNSRYGDGDDANENIDMVPENPTMVEKTSIPIVFTEGTRLNSDIHEQWNPTFDTNLSSSDKFYIIIAVVAILTTMLALSLVMFKKMTRRTRQYRTLRDHDFRVDPPSSNAALLVRD